MGYVCSILICASCMRVYGLIPTYIEICMCTYYRLLHTHTRTQTHAHTHIHRQVHAHLHTHTHSHTRTHIHTHTCTQTHTYTHVHMYSRRYAYAHIVWCINMHMHMPLAMFICTSALVRLPICTCGMLTSLMTSSCAVWLPAAALCSTWPSQSRSSGSAAASVPCRCKHV